MVHPGLLINANQRLHYQAKGRKAAALRLLGRDLGQQLDPAGDRRVRIVYTFGFLDRRSRDVDNLAPTTKALTDGIRDAGILIDDSDRYIEGPDRRTGPLSPEASKRPTHARRVRVTVTLTESTEAAA